MSIDTPSKLFEDLIEKRNGPIKKPWPLELEILDMFSGRLQDERRVAIELPTGSGKSIIGLVLLEFYRRQPQNKRVAILTSSIALSDTMFKRCLDLGIEGAIITGKRKAEAEALARAQNKRKYARKLAVGIMNYWSYMMADDVPPADVLVVDDADFFENFLASYYSVVVSRKRDSYIWGQLMDALEQYKIYQASIETFKYNIHSDETLLVYFIHSIEMGKKLRTLALTSPGSVSRELSFSLGPNHDSLESYLMFVTSDEIVFTPFITPGLNSERLRNVEKLILMSATIGSSAGIHRTLGSAERLTAVAEKDVKSQVGTMGKRIVFPIDGISPSSKIDNAVLSGIDKIFAKFPKALIICNSRRDAEIISRHLQDNGIAVINYEGDAELAAFSSAKTGAMIAAGRYVGIDLPDEACRVVVVPKMPFVISPNDALTRDILEDTGFLNEKVSHRLVQAFGRCNRNPQDYAIYFMLDSQLANDNQADRQICGYFPKRMRAELDFGQDYADLGSLNRCVEIGQALLENKLPAFEAKIEEHMKLLEDVEIRRPTEPYLVEIRAWHDLTQRKNYLDAGEKFLTIAREMQKDSELSAFVAKIAWLYYLAAESYYLAYLNYPNESYKSKTEEYLQTAVKLGQSSWFSGIQVIINSLTQTEKKQDQIIFDKESEAFREKLLRNWREFFKRNSTKKREPKKVWNEIIGKIGSGTHGEVCDALQLVFEEMGFEVRRKREDEGAPDIELFVAGLFVCVVEVKTREEKVSADSTSTEVGRDAVDQVGGHKPAYQNEYKDHKVYALLFTNKEKFSDVALAKAANNVRLLRSKEFSFFLNSFFELMEAGTKASSQYSKVSIMAKMLMPEDFQRLFETQQDPEITIEQLSALIKW